MIGNINDTITLERRRYAALIEALKLARYALLRSGRRFQCPPYDGYSLAAQIDKAIAETCSPTTEVRS